MDKKNLDALFREKFKTFREVPDEKVWTAIENSLDKKRKKRIIPLWWQLGGVAAVLAIALVTFYTLNDLGDETPTITTIEKSNVKDKKQHESDVDLKKDQKDDLQIPEVNKDAVAGGAKDGGNINTDIANSDATSPKDKSTKNSSNRSPEKNQLVTNASDNNRKTADRDHETADKNEVLKNDNTHVPEEQKKDAIAMANAKPSKKMDTSQTDSKKKSQDGLAAGEGSPKTISDQVPPKTIPQNSDKEIAQNDQIGKDDNKADDNKKSILDVLEELNEEETVVEESESRWSAGPNVAPVYFNAMGEGSPIDPGFSPNSKSGSTNLSFGVSIAYAVTKKLSVRSGIHKAEYGYNTNNVGFSPTLAASTSGRLQNIDFAAGPENLSASSPNLNLDSSDSVAPEFSTLNSTRDGTIAQSFGYLEVPLELNYALIDRRIGVNLVGGISSLFLIDNSLSLNSGELTTEIGEANNLNNLNFSTNIGFGVNYKFTPKVQLNIEPVFKYQLNTFSNVSGEFRPFTIGVYSGLNFRF